ncbi:glycopeptide antibiotics resistance protein [Paenibacillus endophyticus]|uniref:Glycopeptide antibiotics resistance protein n=1 Tax=Paenibacillus endophyticus TaxID=1294268 RepID=A0A7W5C4L8_9BACL|nr:VanZ family protein [Paenibacillus endophyticus]MBB3151068.1 glycopeptide antibiotics resistance protein [Paenibacillus endophyticus]
MKTNDIQFMILRVVFLITFLVYLLLLLKVILFKAASPFTMMDYLLDFNLKDFKRSLTLSSNFVPFKTISSYAFHTSNQNIVIRNVVGNIILFIPFGFLLPVIAGRKLNFVQLIISSFLLSLFLELIQLFSRIGSFDVDDLLLNTLGAILGFFTLNVITKVIRHRVRK